MDPMLSNGLAILEVAWVNILLSGDNAVVIALACRSLPQVQRRWGIILGSGAAIVLRIVFAFIVTWLMTVPYLQAVGGALLLWIAISLARGDDSGNHDIKAPETLWHAVGTIAVADAAMSLDNVIAIAAIARDNYWLFIFGLILSIPLIVVGATLITALLTRFPILVWAGAAVLGFIAGEMIADDAAILANFGLTHSWQLHYAAAIAGTALVVAAAYILRQRERRIA
jgi:YjbE family integral membrane protein